MEPTRQDSLGAPPASLPARQAPLPLHSDPGGAQLGQIAQMSALVIQQARDTAAALEQQAKDVYGRARSEAQELLGGARAEARELLSDARAEARETVRKAEEQSARCREEADRYVQDARAQAERELATARAQATTELSAAKAQAALEMETLKRHLEAEKRIALLERDNLQQQIAELRSEARNAYDLAMKARATIGEEARKEFEQRTKELTNLHSVVQTTTDLAKAAIRPPEAKTTTTEVVGNVITQFLVGTQAVLEKALDRSEGVQELVTEYARKGRARIASPNATDDGKQGAAETEEAPAPPPPPAPPPRTEEEAQEAVDQELLRQVHSLRLEDIPESMLARVCQEQHGHTDLSKLSMRDIHAAGFLYLLEQRQAATSPPPAPKAP